jgi:nucleotide-binding universal stress UspA family protein
MLGSILLPLDGSDLSERAIPFAASVARATNKPVTVLYGRLANLFSTDAPFDPFSAVEKLRKLGASATVETATLYHEEPATYIADAATTTGASLIVMSTHGRGGVGRWLYGSVADGVLHRTHVPVMLIGPHIAAGWTTGPSKIMVTLDGSRLSELALTAAKALASAFGASLLLARTSGPLEYAYAEGVPFAIRDAGEDLAAAADYLEEIARPLRDSGLKVDIQVQPGDAGIVLADMARHHGADLMIMGSHGRGGLFRAVMGSVATATLRRASVPIVIVRPTQEEIETAHRTADRTVTLALNPAEVELLRDALRGITGDRTSVATGILQRLP